MALHYVPAIGLVPVALWGSERSDQRLLSAGASLGLVAGGVMIQKRKQAIPDGVRVYPWLNIFAYPLIVAWTVWVLVGGGADPDGRRYGRYLVACFGCGLMLTGLPFASLEILRACPPTIGGRALWRARPNE